jgi:hypothetical protein
LSCYSENESVRYRYDTIVIDLQKRHPIEMLAERDSAAAKA